MFCDNLGFDSPTNEPVALARPFQLEIKAHKSNPAKSSKLPNIMNYNQILLSHGISPTNVNVRSESLHPASEKSHAHAEDNVTMRGPKVLTKNLPEVFVSGNLSAHKVRKVSGLKRRSRIADIERDSVTAVSAQIIQTEPDGDARCHASPVNLIPVGYSHRASERKQKTIYERTPGYLKEFSERLSTGGSPLRFGHDSHPENYTPIPSSSINENLDRQRSVKPSNVKGEVSFDVNSLSPRTEQRRNSNFSSFLSRMNGVGSALYLDTKLPYNSNLGYPRSATNQQTPQINLEINKRPSISYKTDLLLAESKENFQANFRENLPSRSGTRDSATQHNVSVTNTSGYVNGYSNNSINIGVPSQFKPKLEENKHLKKLIVFKKIASRSPKEPNPTDTTNDEVRPKVVKPTIVPTIRLNQLITLKKVCTTINKGTLKRMLHAPTFKIYDLQEEPISELSSKETLHIKERLNEWRSAFFNSHHLVRLFSCFWNSPEGCVSILLESSKSDFLNELISHFGSAPERCIQPLAQDLLLGINEIHQKLRKPHGYISLNEVYTDPKGRFKLGPGASQAFAQASQQHKATQFNEEGIINTVQKVAANQLEPKQLMTPTTQKESIAQDMFDFGFALLQCAIGDFSMYDPLGQLTLENLKHMLGSKALKKYSQSQHTCCLLHNEDFVRRIIGSSNTPNNSATLKKKVITNSFMLRSPKNSEKKAINPLLVNTHIPLLEVLTTGNRFSEAFVDFLCNCLKLEEKNRMGTSELLNHSFLSENHVCKGPVVSVKEFLRMRSKENEALKIGGHEKVKSEHLEKFSEALGVVFLNRDVKEKCEGMLNKEVSSKFEDRKIVDLADELEVSPRRLWNRLKYVVNA